MVEHIVEAERRIPVRGKYDVIVVGGGPAGICSAAAAAVTGAKTLLVERYGFLGGMMTAGLVIGLHTDKLAPMKQFGEKKPLIGGLAQDLVKRLIDMGGAVEPGVWMKHTRIRSNYLPSDPELLKIVSLDLLKESHAQMLLHSLGVRAILVRNTVQGVFIESKSGREALLADVVVDATGDGDVAVTSGAGYERHAKALPMTIMVTLGGVDIGKAKEYYPGSPALKKVLDVALKEGFKKESVLPERPVAPSLPMRFVWLPPKILPKYWQRHDESHGWGASYKGDCTDVKELTQAEIETRKRLVPMVNFLRRNVRGYEKCYLANCATQIGTRESRRIKGEYVLTLKNDIDKARKHPDNICQCRRNRGDSVDEAGPAFDIPYRCLVPRNVDGLLVAGRCISIDHPSALIIAIRDSVQSMGIGQAAGVAAALASKNKVQPRDLDVGLLQRTLVSQGMNLGD